MSDKTEPMDYDNLPTNDISMESKKGKKRKRKKRKMQIDNEINNQMNNEMNNKMNNKIDSVQDTENSDVSPAKRAKSDKSNSKISESEKITQDDSQTNYNASKISKIKLPCITYDLDELFSNNGKRPGGSHLTFKDIRTLLMLTVHGDTFPCLPTWCCVKEWQKILNTVVIMAGCVSAEDYEQHRNCFPFLTTSFPKPVPVCNEGNGVLIKSPLESLLKYKMPKKLQARKKNEKDNEGHGKLEAYQYVLTEEQLTANEFPQWNSAAKEHGVISTRKNTKLTRPHGNSKLFAVDCEMCNVEGNERALTRISVVDSSLNTVYDKLVKPDLPIIDYLTEYSGITAEMLQDVNVTLQDVQKDLLQLFEADTILIGHSLDFDLRSLKLHHDNIIDTSVLYVDQRGPRYKPSLKYLVKTYLRRDIQNSKSGHCSIEDAKACMELVLLKLQKGWSFANPDNETESIFEALSRAQKRGALIDSAHIVRQHCYGNSHCLSCDTDEQVVKNCQRFVKEVDFVFAHLKDYENLMKGKDEVPDVSKENAFKSLDDSISGMLNSAPSSSLVVVSLTSGYIPPDIMKLLRDKTLRKSDVVKEVVKKARQGLCFVKIT